MYRETRSLSLCNYEVTTKREIRGSVSVHLLFTLLAVRPRGRKRAAAIYSLLGLTAVMIPSSAGFAESSRLISSREIRRARETVNSSLSSSEDQGADSSASRPRRFFVFSGGMYRESATAWRLSRKKKKKLKRARCIARAQIPSQVGARKTWRFQRKVAMPRSRTGSRYAARVR